jgi:hypothetical protein|tara:strand:- start:89 stop:460 length:372 start_codon:yes stop_codon:yes gene_type:complete
MIGNLEPEEHVMDDSVMYPGGMLGQLAVALEKMGWDQGDNVAVEIAGTSVYEIEGAGTKWAPVKGTRKYNKDAFIIIKNLDRNPTVPSVPNPELKGHHLKSEKELAAELKRSDDAKGYDTYSK